jgi:hypothetical protein
VDVAASQRASAVIFTSDYGEAGAINELGRGTGLPGAVSGHNTYGWRGPGNPNATTVVAVLPGPMDISAPAGYLRQFFGSVRVAATLSTRTASTTRSGAATSMCAPSRASLGPDVAEAPSLRLTATGHRRIDGAPQHLLLVPAYGGQPGVDIRLPGQSPGPAPSCLPPPASVTFDTRSRDTSLP